MGGISYRKILVVDVDYSHCHSGSNLAVAAVADIEAVVAGHNVEKTYSGYKLEDDLGKFD